MKSQRPPFRWSRVVLAVAATGLLAVATHRGMGDDPPAEKTYESGVVIQFEGTITPLLESFLYRKLDEARQRGADIVILEIDSPGGFLESSLDISDRLRNLDWARTVAFVPREALSGAAIAALGCDEIVMAPDARLGDAGAVFQGKDALFRYAPEKIRSELAGRVRDLAEAENRPPALAEAMVDMDLVVYRVRSRQTGEERLMGQHEIDSSDGPDEWEKVKPVMESREGYFLTVNGKRAVELQLADAVVADRDAVIKRYGLRDEVAVLRPTAVDTAVTILNFPFATGFLLVIGMIALFVELSAPGIGLGGLVSGLCFALFFWSRFLGGTAGWLEVILFVAGVVFVGVELFVIPGFGVAGMAGGSLMLVSMLMASQHFLVPSTGRELNVTLNSLLVIMLSIAAFGVSAAGFSRYFGRLPILNRLVLQPPAVDEENEGEGSGGSSKDLPRPSHRFPVQEGDWGVAESPLRPAGKVRFGQEYVDVVTDGTYVEAGRQVRVIKIGGNRVVVREIQQ